MSPDSAISHREGALHPEDRFRKGDLWFFAGLVLASFVIAWLEVRGHKGDSIAYYDLSNAIRQHNWQACFNASWSPLYPALLTVGRALFGFDPRYAATAGRVVNLVVALALFASSYFLALSVRSYVVSRGIVSPIAVSRDAAQRFFLPARSLMVWVTTFTFFLWSNDLNGEKPDTLLTVCLLLTTGFLLRGLASTRWQPFLLAGVFAGCAYWTKSFAFPFVGMLLLFVMISQWKNRRALLQLATTAVVFFCIALPYIAHISAQKQRFTIGDAGRLNSAWYGNGADRQNPVADRSVDNFGSALGTYKHPAELLAAMPEIAYFPPGRVFGAMPAWADFSYWSDGLHAQFLPMQNIHNFIGNSKTLLAVIPMRIQLLALVAALWIFGLRLYARKTMGPALIAIVAAALVAIALYLSVHFEGRYIVFSAIICGAVFAAAAHSSGQPPQRTALHRVLLLLSFVILAGEVQWALHTMKSVPTEDRPASARFDVSEYNVGQNLVSRFGPHPQVACMGWYACYDDALWAWYGEATVSATIAMPHLQESGTTAQACNALMGAGPAALDAMRARQLRAVVGYFANGTGCSPQWQAIPGAPGYYILTL